MTELPGPPAAVAPQAAVRRAPTFLGRLAQAVHEQNWFAVVLELFIVVVGVVVGFQVTAWGETRAARAEEQDLLRGLRAEFTELLPDLELQVEKHRRVERAVATALDALGAAEAAGVLADVVEDEVASREIVITQLEPVLWRVMDTRDLRSYELVTGTLPPAAMAASSDVPVDSELIGVLVTRRYWLLHTIGEFAGPQAEARRILELIERSLDGASP